MNRRTKRAAQLPKAKSPVHQEDVTGGLWVGGLQSRRAAPVARPTMAARATGLARAALARARGALRSSKRLAPLARLAVDAAAQLAARLARGPGADAVPGVDCATPRGFQIARACPVCTELNELTSPKCFCGHELPAIKVMP